MTTEKMTIHRALAELKTIDSRIMKEIETAKFCTAAKNGETKLFGAPALEFIENGKSTYADTRPKWHRVTFKNKLL